MLNPLNAKTIAATRLRARLHDRISPHVYRQDAGKINHQFSQIGVATVLPSAGAHVSSRWNVHLRQPSAVRGKCSRVLLIGRPVRLIWSMSRVAGGHLAD